MWILVNRTHWSVPRTARCYGYTKQNCYGQLRQLKCHCCSWPRLNFLINSANMAGKYRRFHVIHKLSRAMWHLFSSRWSMCLAVHSISIRFCVCAIQHLCSCYTDGGREDHDTTLFWTISKIFLRRTLTFKILKKFTVVYFFTVNYHEFFQNFWSQCASQKNFSK